MSELQLYDYQNGYRFRIKCHACGYGWYEMPGDLLSMPAAHDRMYLDEVARLLVCKSCRASSAEVMPIIIMDTHHFVGGLA